MTVERVSHICLNCKKEGNLRCNRCKAAFYCSKECQVQDWKSHKAICNASKKDSDSKESQELIKFCDKNSEKFVPVNNDANKVWDQGSKYYLQKKYELTAEAYVHSIYLDSTMTLRCKRGDNAMNQLYKHLLDVSSNPEDNEKINSKFLDNPFAGILYLYSYCKAYTGEDGFLVCFTRLAEKYPDNGYVHLCRGRVFGEMTSLLRQKDAMKESRVTLKTSVDCLERAYDWFSKMTFTSVNEGNEEKKSCYLLPIIYELAFAYRDIGRIADSIKWYNRFMDEAPKDHHAVGKAKSALQFLEKAKAHFGDVYVPSEN